MWRLGLGITGLLPLARRLGADVPYFLFGGTSLGLARGDELYPLRRQIQAHFVLVTPDVAVRRRPSFARLDARLTPRENGNTIFRFISSDLEGQPRYRLLTNELEEAALEEAPVLRDQVKTIRSLLVREGAELTAFPGAVPRTSACSLTARARRVPARRFAARGIVPSRCERSLSSGTGGSSSVRSREAGTRPQGAGQGQGAGTMEITDVKVIPVDDEKLKAFVSIVFDGDFVVTDIKIIHGPKGLFVSMPSKKRKDGTFKDIAHPLNNKMRQYLEEKILGVYKQQVSQAPAAAVPSAGAGEPGAAA